MKCNTYFIIIKLKVQTYFAKMFKIASIVKLCIEFGFLGMKVHCTTNYAKTYCS